MRVHDELDVVDLAERLEDALQHVLGDVEVEGAHVEAHRAAGVGPRCVTRLGCGSRGSVLLGLRSGERGGYCSLRVREV